MAITIKKISALEVLDSRGDPTVETQVILSDGTTATASVPSGASTGAFEAHELRDADSSRYGGRGVRKAVSHVNGELHEALKGFDAYDQAGLDQTMIRLDGTDSKRRLGANAIVSVSMAVARAAAAAKKMPLYRYIRELDEHKEDEYRLPVPLVNVLNGGKHADTNLDIQEFWVIPHKAKSFAEKIRHASEIFHTLGNILRRKGMDTDVGDEGGYAPNFQNYKQVFEMIIKAIEESHYKAGIDVAIGFDAGASVLYDAEGETYHLELEGERLSNEEMTQYYLKLLKSYPILAIEDPLAEEEWAAWKHLTAVIRRAYPKVHIIGDDIFVTNVKRLKKGIDESVANSILVKPNQIGTLTETLACIAVAKEHGYSTAISHRSGSTTDTFIADLAVAVNSEFIKTGSTARGERTAKFNRLLEIENELYG